MPQAAAKRTMRNTHSECVAADDCDDDNDCAADAATKPNGDLPAQPCEPSGTGQADFALSCLRSPT